MCKICLNSASRFSKPSSSESVYYTSAASGPRYPRGKVSNYCVGLLNLPILFRTPSALFPIGLLYRDTLTHSLSARASSPPLAHHHHLHSRTFFTPLATLHAFLRVHNLPARVIIIYLHRLYYFPPAYLIYLPHIASMHSLPS